MTSKRGFRIAVAAAIIVLAVVLPRAQGGPFSAEIENFWRLISNGGRTFQSLQAVNINVTGTCTGCGGGSLPTDPSFDSMCLDIANGNACLNYGPGNLSSARDATMRLVSGTDPQEFVVFGTDGGSSDTEEICSIKPSTSASGTVEDLIFCGRGDQLGNAYLRVESETAVTLTVSNADKLVVNGGGTNIRSDNQYGFSLTSSGPIIDSVVAGLQYLGTALVKVTDGSTGVGTIQTGFFASSASEIIASATEIAVSHSVVHVSGTAAVATIDPPDQCPATCEIVLIPDGQFTLATGGNVASAASVLVNRPIRLVYDGALWYPYDTLAVPVGGAEVKSVSTNELASRFVDDSGFAPFTAGGLRTHGFLALDSTSFAQSSSPAITSGFGTSPALTVANGSIAFVVTIGSGGTASTGILAMPEALTGWNCFAIDRTTNVVTRETLTTTTAVTLTAALPWSAADVLQVSCFAY